MLSKAARLLGALGAVTALGVAAPRALTADATKSAEVDIANFHYTPPSLVVSPGTTVTWKNTDDSPHSVREKSGKFKSAALDTDDTFSQTFAAPGEYDYICSIHPYMRGKIVVKSGGS